MTFLTCSSVVLFLKCTVGLEIDGLEGARIVPVGSTMC